MVHPYCLRCVPVDSHGARMILSCVCASMVLTWRLHGASMALQWGYGAFMVLPWCSLVLAWRLYGACTVLYGVFMVLRLYSNGASMGAWRCHWQWMDSHRGVCALIGLPWWVHGASMVLSWCFHCASMVLSWWFHDAFTDFHRGICAFMVLPWWFYGTP